jgi:hypothetical protein
MMSISPPAYTGYIALLELLTHHCDIVETETKVGPSKIAPVDSHLGAAVSHSRLSGRDLDQIVAQLMWFLRGLAAHSTVPHVTSNIPERHFDDMPTGISNVCFRRKSGNE